MKQVAFIQWLSAPQRAFFKAQTRFVGYGGARGGGKSWAVQKKAVLLSIRYPGIKILLMRKTFPELRENHILPLLTQLQGIARYKDTDKSFTFPSGSRIRFGYCDTDKDVNQYQGQEYDIIMMDEATHFTEYQFSVLTACLRGANDFPKRFYITCNPGGVGHAWVKRLFVDGQYKEGENPEDYTFIRARVYDNKPLMDQDPGYVKMLEALPDTVRAAWLNGDWDAFIGQYFTEWDRELHVVRPFPLPADWRRYFTMDYGLDMLAGYWIAMDPRGNAWVYREIYQPGLRISQAAEAILERTAEPVSDWIAPPDLWNRRQDTGKSVVELFAEQGIRLRKAQNDRVAGWLDLHEWLSPTVDETGAKAARLRIFANCTNLIRTLPLLQYDDRNPNDVAGEPHELTHAPDALRYFVAGRPRPSTVPLPKDEDRPEYDDQVEELLRYGM